MNTSGTHRRDVDPAFVRSRTATLRGSSEEPLAGDRDSRLTTVPVLQHERHLDPTVLCVLLPFHGQTSGTLGPNALYSYSAQEITALRRPPHFGDCRAGERNNGLAVPARQPRTGGSETRQEKGPRRLSRMRATRTGSGQKIRPDLSPGGGMSHLQSPKMKRPGGFFFEIIPTSPNPYRVDA